MTHSLSTELAEELRLARQRAQAKLVDSAELPGWMVFASAQDGAQVLNADEPWAMAFADKACVDS